MAKRLSPSATTATAQPAPAKTIVLFAVCGQSPAILTETAWGLATSPSPVIPDKVHVITTSQGRDTIQKSLLDSGIWDRLRTDLKAKPGQLQFGSSSSIQIIAGEDGDLNDIRTQDDNSRAADFILCELRKFTENPDTTVVASIAGGRKTMSVFMGLCMSLLGREQDRLCHVLVSEPFDNPKLLPRFFFPGRKAKYTLDGKEVSLPPQITVADIPFVRLRNLFSGQLGSLPGNYMSIVEMASGAVREAGRTPVKLCFDTGMFKPACSLNGKQLKLNPKEYACYLLLAWHCKQGTFPAAGADDLHTEVTEWLDRTTFPTTTRWPATALRQMKNETYAGDMIRKTLSAISTKLVKLGLPTPVREVVRPSRPEDRGNYGLRLRPEEIEITPKL